MDWNQLLGSSDEPSPSNIHFSGLADKDNPLNPRPPNEVSGHSPATHSYPSAIPTDADSSEF